MSNVFDTIKFEGDRIVLTKEQDDYVRDIANSKIIMLYHDEFQRIYNEEKAKILNKLTLIDLFK